jgi:hypothetical protein
MRLKACVLAVLLPLPLSAEIVRPTAQAVRYTEGKTVTFRFPGWDPTDPIPAGCYASDCVIVQRFEAPFGRTVKIRRIGSFFGVDQGNTGEYHIEVLAEDGTRLYMRSPHKEAGFDHYDAWGDPWYFDSFKTKALVIHLRIQNAHPTVRGRVHFELVVLVE